MSAADDDFFAEMEAEARASRPHDSGAFSRAKPAERATSRLAQEAAQLALDLPVTLADPADYPFKGTLTETQLKVLGASRLRPGFAAWVDAGGGKSAACIAETARLYRDGVIDGVIVVGPMGPYQQWLDEQFPLWCAAPWRAVDAHWAKTRINRVLERANDDVMGVLGINYEALRTPGGQRLIGRFMAVWPRIYLVADESSRIKSPKARQTQELAALSRRCPYRRVLSGTPILKGVEDLFTQYDVVEPGITGFHEFLAFRRYYCRLEPVTRDVVRVNRGQRETVSKVIGHRIIGYRNERELARRTAPHSIRVPSTEFHDSNPLIMRVFAPMSEAQARAYADMKRHLVADIDAQRITAANALVKMNKLLQLASGFIFDEEKDVHWVGDNKIQAVHDLLDELDEPIVLFAPFVPLIDRLELALRERDDRPLFRYKSRATVLEWREAGGIILGNQGSGLGIGQNLQASAATIYAANGFGAEPRWQSLKRTDRLGQDRQPRYWDLAAPGTLDFTALDDVLAGKEDISKRNLDALRRMLA